MKHFVRKGPKELPLAHPSLAPLYPRRQRTSNKLSDESTTHEQKTSTTDNRHQKIVNNVYPRCHRTPYWPTRVMTDHSNARFNAEAAAWDSNPDVHRATAGALKAILARFPELEKNAQKGCVSQNGRLGHILLCRYSVVVYKLAICCTCTCTCTCTHATEYPRPGVYIQLGDGAIA